MDKFKVAMSREFLKPDGTPTYPSFDLSPLKGDPDIELTYLPRGEVIRAADVIEQDALILLGASFERDSFPSDDRLTLIARFGVGFETIDANACTDHGVALVITPDGVRRPVAVAILTLMMALTGKLMKKDQLARHGPEGWSARSEFMGVGLVGKTLGSLGVGNIGAEMFRLAQPLDMKFIAHDPYVAPNVPQALGVRMVGLESLFQESDILTVNCPLNDETHNMVNAELLALMKPNAYLINTARGGIVDQKALTEMLAADRIAGAGLDVFAEEPLDAEDPLTKLNNVILAPHSLCWTDECFAGIGASDIRAVLDVKRGLEPSGIVNREILTSPHWRGKLKAYGARFG
jgi:phosphoglycerate dehydrogenase-like enzyme